MSQQVVCDWLLANPGWHETKEIVQAPMQGYKGVQTSLANASRAGYIEQQRSNNRLGKEWRARI